MRSSWTVLAITLAIQALVSMALLTIPVMAPVVAKQLGVPAVAIGLYVAIVYSGALLGSVASGAAVVRFGAIRVSQTCLLLCGLGLLLCAVPSLPCTALGALLVGLGYGPVTPASSHLLARSTPPERMSLVFSVKQTGVPVGGVLAGALVPTAQLAFGWQGALVAVAVANFACIAIAHPLAAQLDADRDPTRLLRLGGLAQPMRMVLGHPALRMLAACSFVFSIAQLSLTTYVVTFLTESLGYGLIAAGLVSSVAQTGGIVGRIAWGWVSDRWLGARRMLVLLASTMAVAALATAALGPSVPALAVMAVLVVFGASAIGWNGVYLAEVARQAPPGQASVATGGTLAITFLGVVIGPPLFGVASSAFGSYRGAYALLAIPTTLCAIALLRNRSLRAAGA